MKLVIEQAHDHMECLDQVRKIHGNDCMIVHSFKQPDSYCIIVAVESTSVKTGVQLVSSVVGTTASQALPLSCEGGYPDSALPAVTTKKLAMNNSREQAGEITNASRERTKSRAEILLTFNANQKRILRNWKQ